MKEGESPLRQKNAEFANSIRTEQRRRLFNDLRRKMEEAEKNGDDHERMIAEQQLSLLFKNHSEKYEEMMALAAKVDEEEEKYRAYLEEMEEESINFEMQQRRMDIEAIKKEMQEFFADEEWSEM